MNQQRDESETRLSAYLDNELTPPQRAEVEAWLARDPEARALLADLQALRKALGALPRGRASADMMEAIRARMERQALLGDAPAPPRPAGRKTAGIGLWAAAASLVLLVSVGGYVFWNLNLREASSRVNQQFAALDKASKETRGQAEQLAMDEPPGAGRRSGVATESTSDERPAPDISEEAVTFFGMQQTPEARGVAGDQPAAIAPPPLPDEGTPDETALALARPESGADYYQSGNEQTYYAREGTGMGSAGAAPKAALDTDRGQHAPAAPTEVITLAYADAGRRAELIDELSSQAVSLKPIDSPARRGRFVEKATEASAGQAQPHSGSALLAEPRPALRKRGDAAVIQDATSQPAAPPYEAARRLSDAESAPSDASNKPTSKDVVEYIMVVPDERTRADLIRRLEQAQATNLGAWQHDLTARRSEPPLPTSRPGTLQAQVRANAPAEPEIARAWPVMSQPAEMGADLYVLRLHIRLQDAATRPAGTLRRSTNPPSSVPVNAPFDPTVLDLGSRTSTRPTTSRPATQP